MNSDHDPKIQKPILRLKNKLPFRSRPENCDRIYSKGQSMKLWKKLKQSKIQRKTLINEKVQILYTPYIYQGLN